MYDQIREYPRRLRAAADMDKAKFYSFGETRLDSMALDCANVIETLLADYDRLKARLEAAIADMKNIADKARENPNNLMECCCFECKFANADECPGFERDDCFEWRGQEVQQ